MDPERLKIREFLSRYFKGRDLQDDENIFATGFVNSLLAMQLVMFVEKEFQLALEDDDLDLENFKSVNTILGLVELKRTAAGI